MLQLTADNIGTYLIDRKILPPQAVVEGKLTIEDRSRRNNNFKAVVPPHSGVVVKQAGRSDGRNERGVRVEAELYAAVHREDALRPLRWFTPRFVNYEADSHVVVTQVVHPATSLARYQINFGNFDFPEDAAVTSGRILSTFHHLGTQAVRKKLFKGLHHDVPTAFQMEVNMGMGYVTDMPAGSRRLLDVIRKETSLESRMDEIRRTWRHEDLVHGDIRWDNFLLTHGGAPGGNLNLKLIDWEAASVGERSWDVASFLAEYVRTWARSMKKPQGNTLEEALEQQVFPWEQFHSSARTFWRAYTGRYRLSRKRSRALFERVFQIVPVRLAQVGLESVQRSDSVFLSALAPVRLAQYALEKGDDEAVAREVFGLTETEVS